MFLLGILASSVLVLAVAAIIWPTEEIVAAAFLVLAVAAIYVGGRLTGTLMDLRGNSQTSIAPSAVAVGCVIVAVVLARSLRDGRGFTIWDAIGLFGGAVFAVGGLVQLVRPRPQDSKTTQARHE